jgi:hypothetical protein
MNELKPSITPIVEMAEKKSTDDAFDYELVSYMKTRMPATAELVSVDVNHGPADRVIQVAIYAAVVFGNNRGPFLINMGRRLSASPNIPLNAEVRAVLDQFIKLVEVKYNEAYMEMLHRIKKSQGIVK